MTSRSELAGFRHGIPERFVPDLMRGRLTEAEHLARYRWAAQLAPERRVLDAGCGTGYGCALLAAGGAREVVGADIARDVLDSVRPDMPPAVRLDVADLGRLPYGNGEFDVVVCFNVIECVDDPGAALDEIVRVLAPDGIVLISTPNRAVCSPASSHHRRLYLPAELRAELESRLAHVTMMRQDVYLVTAVLDDGTFVAVGRELEDVSLFKIAAGERDREEFTLAVAGRGEVARVPAVAVMTNSLQVESWYAALAEQTATIAADRARIMELEENTGALQSQLAARDAEVARMREALANVVDSLSWRLTAPLRRAKRAARGRR